MKLCHECVGDLYAKDRDLLTRIPVVAIEKLVSKIQFVDATLRRFGNSCLALAPRLIASSGEVPVPVFILCSASMRFDDL
jgi:hypothetical protein